MDNIKGFSIPVFYFGFAVMLYDLWLLVDFLVQTLIDVVEFRGFLRWEVKFAPCMAAVRSTTG